MDTILDALRCHSTVEGIMQSELKFRPTLHCCVSLNKLFKLSKATVSSFKMHGQQNWLESDNSNDCQIVNIFHLTNQNIACLIISNYSLKNVLLPYFKG